MDLHVWLIYFSVTLDLICKRVGTIETKEFCQDWDARAHNLIMDAKDVFMPPRGQSNNHADLWKTIFGIDLPSIWLLRELEMGEFASEFGIVTSNNMISVDFNFLVLSMLYHAQSNINIPISQRADISECYDLLRERLLATITAPEDDREGGRFAFWQYYDGQTGAGRGERGFTGGTSLFLLIESEDYPDLSVGSYLRT